MEVKEKSETNWSWMTRSKCLSKEERFKREGKHPPEFYKSAEL